MDNIQENIRLISKFIGFNYDDTVMQCKNEVYESGHRSDTIINDPNYWSCYHNSWDWLMIVVEKIENLEDVECFNIETYRILIKTYGDFKLEFWTNGFSKIEAVYEAVIDFIKWYNQQNKL